MAKRSFRWEFVALWTVLTLAILSLGYSAYLKMEVVGPLQRALERDVDVRNVGVRSKNGVTVLELELGKVDDLPRTYTRLREAAEEKLGDAFRLEIADSRDEELEDAYYSVHYYLEEASVRGNFGEMIDSCRGLLKDQGLEDYKISLDEGHIFIQMAHGDNYLYAVLARQNPKTGGAQ